MTDAPDYDVYTLKQDPFHTLIELHEHLSNHAGTFTNVVCERTEQDVASISPSVVHVEGRFYVSALTTTTGRQ